jgi:hypothetical protein
MNSFLFFIGFLGFCILMSIVYSALSLFIFFISPPFGEVNLPINIKDYDFNFFSIILAILSFLISYKYIGPWLLYIIGRFIDIILNIFNK